MKRSRAVLALGIIFAVLPSGVITVAGYSVLQDASSRSREVNRAVLSSEPTLQPVSILNNTYTLGSGFFNTSFACNVTAAAVIPRAVVVGAGDFNLDVDFTVVVAANVSFASGGDAGWVGMAGWVSAWFYNDSYWTFGWGDFHAYPPYPTFRVNGTSLGGTGVGLWNVTVQMHPFSSPPPRVLQNQSDWLSFTTQADAYLVVDLKGYVHFVNGNVTENSYFASFWFPFKGSPTTFIRFGYPVAAWLGYGASVLVAVVSLCLFVGVRVRRMQRKPRWKADAFVT